MAVRNEKADPVALQAEWRASRTQIWEQAALDWRRLTAAEQTGRHGVVGLADILGYTVSHSKSGPTSAAAKLATAGRKLRSAAAGGDRGALERIERAEALGPLIARFAETALGATP
jgi:hypothetical protein